jgi:hypothetical protein
MVRQADSNVQRLLMIAAAVGGLAMLVVGIAVLLTVANPCK